MYNFLSLFYTLIQWFVCIWWKLPTLGQVRAENTLWNRANATHKHREYVNVEMESDKEQKKIFEGNKWIRKFDVKAKAEQWPEILLWRFRLIYWLVMDDDVTSTRNRFYDLSNLFKVLQQKRASLWNKYVSDRCNVFRDTYAWVCRPKQDHQRDNRSISPTIVQAMLVILASGHWNTYSRLVEVYKKARLKIYCWL